MPAFAPVDRPEVVWLKDTEDVGADIDVVAAEPELLDVEADAFVDAELLNDAEKRDKSFCWNATVIGCPHMVTCPRLAPSSVEVTMRVVGTGVPRGLAKTVVVLSELNIDVHPASSPAARSPSVAEEICHEKLLVVEKSAT
jgi:hypothetical protein